MAISVIIPAYKARKFLADCLESIAKQTLQPAEVLIIDDASPEPIDDIVADFAYREGYPPIRLIKHQENRGQAAGRNTGMKAASGDWLAFIDCDDMWAPNHLESVMAKATESGSDLVFCPAILFDKDPHDLSNYCLHPLTEEERNMRPMALFTRCFIITSSTIIRKSTLQSADGFDESPALRAVEDLDCFMRLLRNGARFAMAQQPTLYYRKHPESATGTPGYISRQCVCLLNRHIRYVDATAKEKNHLTIQTYWHCAISLRLAKADDQYRWLFLAIYKSIGNPPLLCRWILRYIRRSKANPAV